MLSSEHDSAAFSLRDLSYVFYETIHALLMWRYFPHSPASLQCHLLPLYHSPQFGSPFSYLSCRRCLSTVTNACMHPSSYVSCRTCHLTNTHVSIHPVQNRLVYLGECSAAQHAARELAWHFVHVPRTQPNAFEKADNLCLCAWAAPRLQAQRQVLLNVQRVDKHAWVRNTGTNEEKKAQGRRKEKRILDEQHRQDEGEKAGGKDANTTTVNEMIVRET